MNPRQKKALEILCSKDVNEYTLLGEGMSSVVYTDNIRVYKVFMLEGIESLSYKKRMLLDLQSKKNLFDGLEFFYPIIELKEISENEFLLIYPYEKSEPCIDFTFDEINDFLVECWQRRIVFPDIKPDNFIRVNNKLKWIDYEPDKFNDNLYLNMAARAFIFAKYPTSEKSFLHKLCRSSINQFDLPELEGLQAFLNNLFAKIIYAESKESFQLEGTNTDKNQISSVDELDFVIENLKIKQSFSIPFSNEINPENLFFKLLSKGFCIENFGFEGKLTITEKNYFKPSYIAFDIRELIEPKEKVSLVIKACVQDCDSIYELTKSIIKQLSSPNKFDERILALDIKEDNFLREYYSKGNWDELILQAKKLVDENIIDRYIFPTSEDFQKVNQKWFGINSTATHSINNVPIGSQLFAFDSLNNNYIFQIDCDVMIGRLNLQHSYLDDMLLEFNNNENVISVGFNIYQGEEKTYKPYFGFDDVGFVPEVRICLLSKSRIEKLLPLKNELVENNFKLSWYRALELKQKQSNYVSIRGGSSESFFIHPQNYRKTKKEIWFSLLDKVEQGIIPKAQIGNVELSSSYFDWTLPKRNGNIIIISCFRNISFDRFLRFWHSLVSQQLKDWELILVDDDSENGLHYFIQNLIKPYQNRITFIRNKFRLGISQNTYNAITHYISNPNSVIVILDADDALIGKNALKNIYDKYTHFNADVVVGKMYRTDKIRAHYKYNPNFINPRLKGGNVWQHIRTFKKYLFDSLSFDDLKIEVASKDSFQKYGTKMKFPEHCWDFAYMVPIIEMSSNPMCINHFNILHDRTTINTPEIKLLKEDEISKILNKKTKSSTDVFFGRKTFLPNLNKIEIDITYDCNLKCFHCNRSCTQAPTNISMSIEQIDNFIQESILINKKWEFINILGGEPTLHPYFQQIISKILSEYIEVFSPATILQITSNGFGDIVMNNLNALPEHPNLFINKNSFKSSREIEYFASFNEAPIDINKNDENEYSKGCWITSYCGIGLNYLGYFPCGVAGGIERVIKSNHAIKSLKDVDISIGSNLVHYCKLCGNFNEYKNNKGDFIDRAEMDNLKVKSISNTWNEIYKNYNSK